MPMDLTSKKIGILINQPFCLEAVVLFTVPLGKPPFREFSSNIQQSNMSISLETCINGIRSISFIFSKIRCDAYLWRAVKQNYIENKTVKIIKVFL
jgi:hypothetical protein